MLVCERQMTEEWSAVSASSSQERAQTDTLDGDTEGNQPSTCASRSSTCGNAMTSLPEAGWRSPPVHVDKEHTHLRDVAGGGCLGPIGTCSLQPRPRQLLPWPRQRILKELEKQESLTSDQEF